MACPSGGFILPPAQRDLGFREFLVSQGPGVLPGRNLRGTESGTSPALFSVPFPRLEVDTRILISRSQRLLKTSRPGSACRSATSWLAKNHPHHPFPIPDMNRDEQVRRDPRSVEPVSPQRLGLAPVPRKAGPDPRPVPLTGR